MAEPTAYDFTIGVRGPYAVVTATGELDIAAVAPLRAAMRQAAQQTGRVVVDLRKVSFMDTYSLRALIALQGETSTHTGASFHVVPGAGIQRVLDLAGTRHALHWISAEQLVQ
jgi:anti-anti-sigma factor